MTGGSSGIRSRIIDSLRRAGCVAAEEEADELIDAADDGDGLERMLARRMVGEPLAWITGRITFCAREVIIDPGVYVPRWQSQTLARLGARLLPHVGCGVDLCTGAGAVALVLQSTCPGATVVATEMDPLAVDCARRNGVTVYQGDLDRPLPSRLEAGVDVMTGVLPYVPNEALHLLPRDVQRFEPRVALDGGPGGLGLVGRAVAASPRWLKRGGWLLLEVGTDQVDEVSEAFAASGFGDIAVIEDDDGDGRGVYGRLESRPADPSGALRPDR